MLTTIEQKLSAIKAINEEKDLTDENLSRAARIIEIQNSITSVVLHTETSQFEFSYLPSDVVVEISEIIQTHYQDRQKELIANAEQLMK